MHLLEFLGISDRHIPSESKHSNILEDFDFAGLC